MLFNLVRTAESANLTVFINGEMLVATDSHPFWEEIVEGVIQDDESVAGLFNLEITANKKFTKLGDRVSIANGQVYFDGDQVGGPLVEQIARFVRDGVTDWQPLVNFYEKVMSNLNEHTRDQLYSWLKHNSFSITPVGNFIGYKGVQRDDDGKLWSVNTGRAIVDGTEVRGVIPNEVGSEVCMPRSEVQFDPTDGCSTGLHVGTYEYAKGWARGALLEVEVDPRDVVSVPTDCNAQKLRTCRYVVRNVIERQRDSVVVDDDDI